MSAILYLYRHIFRNRLRKAIRKPVTYVYLAFIILYLFMIPYSFKTMFSEFHMDNPEGMAAVLTAFAFWVIPANLIAYAKRKGLLFRKSDTHFLFTSPISPKKVLLYAHVKNLFVNLFLNLAVAVGGAYIFRVTWWQMVLYFLFSVIVENLLESGIMLLCYGNQRLDERGRALVVKSAYGLVAILVLIAAVGYSKEGLSWDFVLGYLHSDAVQMVPVIGWYTAVIHLLFTGPTVVNVICSALYLMLFVVVLLGALRMKCTGEYYEDAMKFADDYEELLVNRRRGRSDLRIGKKKRFGKAAVSYRGSGAKAIFYRQLLEYKKNRFFFFDMTTLFCLGGSIFIAWLYHSEGGFGDLTGFMIPMVMAYVVFIFTTLSGKWGVELKSPYTFLIPDNAFNKLWYATAIQHIQAIVNGTLLAVPAGIVMGQSPLTIGLSILMFVMLNACKLYILAVAEIAVGNVLGQVGKQMFQLFLMGIAITVAVIGGILGMMVGGLNLAYIMITVLLTGETAIFMTVASLCFYRMETVEG